MKVLLLLAVLLCVCLPLSKGHAGHSHDEDPAFKYSRAANEDPVIGEEPDFNEEDIVEVPPQYSNEKPTGGHHHGHSHGSHGHSHGGHGHSHGGHGHGHGHGHSHGAPQREPTREEREKHRERLHREWDDDPDAEAETRSNETFKLWWQALASTLAISIAPFVILFFFSIDNSEENSGNLKILLSFAAGGLLGDAFLHLIPHAIMAQGGDEHGHGHGHSHSHSHSHGHSHDGDGAHSHDLTVGLGVMCGILAFLVVEKTVRIFNGGQSAHGHSHAPLPKPSEKDEAVNKEKKKDSGGDKEKKKKDSGGDKGKKKDDKEKKEATAEVKADIRPAGYLNLFADFFHNFTDGLAIGASFLAGERVGIGTTIMIMVHEIPHEIGDYAILIQSGVGPFKAKCLQLLTAVGALAGCMIALFAEGGTAEATASASVYILPFTAGGFIYIAMVSVIPELLEGKASVKQTLWEILALLVGVGMMVFIAKYE